MITVQKNSMVHIRLQVTVCMSQVEDYSTHSSGSQAQNFKTQNFKGSSGHGPTTHTVPGTVMKPKQLNGMVLLYWQ